MHDPSFDGLRRRLYEPGATAADVDRFVSATGGEAAEIAASASAPAPPPRRRRRWALAAGVLAAVVIAAVAWTTSREGEPAASPTATRTSTAFPVAAGEPLLAPASVRSGFRRALASGAKAGILPYLEANPPALPDGLRTRQRADSTEYAGEGPSVIPLEPSELAQQGGHLTVIVVTDRATKVQWRADRAASPQPPTVARYEGVLAAGAPVGSTVAYRPRAPMVLTVLVPDGVRWGVVVDFTD